MGDDQGDDVTVTTSVTLTGTGVPHPSPGRAGPGTLVRYGDNSLQFDAGRGTVIRLEEAGAPTYALSAVFLTHYHSDHVIDLADVTMTRWLMQQLHPCGPLTIVSPEGPATTFVGQMLDPYIDDIHVRTSHVGAEAPSFELRSFPAESTPTEVWRSDDGSVVVEAVKVHHEPVVDAVAYRVTTPTAVVVVSGDTRVCDEVEQLSTGCDVLVHEACRATALRDTIAGTVFETILSYHADTVPLGGLAERAGVRHLLLTHLIPAPTTEDESAAFADDLRQGGYGGEITVGHDLTTIEINNPKNR
jgi:ribonuclease Z